MDDINILNDFETFVKTSSMVPPLGGTNNQTSNQPLGTPPSLTAAPVMSGAPAIRQPNITPPQPPATMPKPLTPTNKPLSIKKF